MKNGKSGIVIRDRQKRSRKEKNKLAERGNFSIVEGQECNRKSRGVAVP